MTQGAIGVPGGDPITAVTTGLPGVSIPEVMAVTGAHSARVALAARCHTQGTGRVTLR